MAAASAMAMMTMASAWSQSSAMGDQAIQEETVARINSKLLDKKAEDALERGKSSAADFRKKADGFKGSQLAALAQSGVDVNYGSALNARTETDLLSIEDEEKIKNNAALEAWGYKTESINAQLNGKYKAQALRNQGNATLLGGISKGIAYGAEGMSGSSSSSGSSSGGSTRGSRAGGWGMNSN